MLPRRSFLHTLAGAALIGSARPALAAPEIAPGISGAESLASRTPPDLDVRDLRVEGDPAFGRRFTLFVPKHLAPGEKVPLLVLLHGLGETGDVEMGVYAWVERYGLGTSYARLRRPPLGRTSRNKTLLPDARLATLNAALAARPFQGLAIACPYTPNLRKLPDPAGALDRYAAWLTDVVIPRARKEAPVFADRAHTTLDGVSMGGSVGIEVFLRRPDAFGAWGGAQSALHTGRLAGYAERFAAIRAAAPASLQTAPMFHLLTSTGDPFHDVNAAFARELAKKGVPHDFVVLPGPHDQPFLRESGTLELLLWHDRRPR